MMPTNKILYPLTYKIKVESTEIRAASAFYDGYNSFDVTAKLLNDLKNHADSFGYSIDFVSEIETKLIQFL